MRGPVAVTGATGFIGTRLVERLVAEGTPVRALVRSPGKLRPRLRDRVELVSGTLEDPMALRRLMEGASMVYHLAGLATAWTRRSEDYFAINVQGVRLVLIAAQLAGVSRLVHVSTVLTRFRGSVAMTPYWASKRLGERLVRDHVAAGGNAVIVQPCRVYGPGPLTDANGATKLIRSYLYDRVPVRLKDGGARGNWVHVDDVVDGMILAARCGRAGESYLLGGENCTVEELFRQVSELSGLRRRVIRIPPALALAFAGAAELGGYLGAPVPITRGWVRTFLQDQAVDIGPTTAALAYRPRPLRIGLAGTIAWLRNISA